MYSERDDYMKLIIAVISNKDIANVLAAISNEGYFATKLNTSGQFLADGHTSVCVGTQEENVPKVYEIIKNNVTKRVVRQYGVDSTLEGSLLKKPVDVEEYGAVSFLLDVEDFQKL